MKDKPIYTYHDGCLRAFNMADDRQYELKQQAFGLPVRDSEAVLHSASAKIKLQCDKLQTVKDAATRGLQRDHYGLDIEDEIIREFLCLVDFENKMKLADLKKKANLI